MSTQTSLVARQYRIQEWASQIQECKNRPEDVTVAQWCNEHGITRSNYYYRQSEVRKALLATIPKPADICESKETSFVDISTTVNHSPVTPEPTDHSVAARIHVGNTSIDLFNTADKAFLKAVFEAILLC